MTCSYGCDDGIVLLPAGVHRCRCPKGERFATRDMRSKWEIKVNRPALYLPLVPDRERKATPIGRERAAGKDE